MAGLKLVAELGGDGSGFERMMNKAKGTANTFGTTAIAPLKNLIAGVFTIGAISNLTKGTIEWASKLRDVADQLGVNVEFLQKLQNGAKLAGADIDDVAKVMNELGKSREDAINNPKGKNAQAFGRMGISSGDISGLSSQAFMEKIMAAFKDGANTQLTNDVQEVGGKSARNLIGAFVTQFQNDVPIASEMLIDSLDDIGDRFTNLGTSIKVSFAPVIDAVATLLEGLLNWMKKSRAFFEGMADVLDPKTVIAGMFGFTSDDSKKNFNDALEAGRIARDNEEQAQKDAEAARVKARQDAAAARAARENSPPQFSPLEIKQAGATASKGRASDALVSVGNFLGQAPGAVNAIAEKQLMVARKQLDTAVQILKVNQQILSKTGNGSTLGIPKL